MTKLTDPTGVVAVDLESAGLEKDAKILGLGWFYDKERNGYSSNGSTIVELFKKALPAAPLAAHNGKFDQTLLFREYKILPPIAFDTYLAATLLPLDKKPQARDGFPKPLSLDSLANHFYGIPSWKDEDFLNSIASQPEEAVAYYNKYDTYYTKKLTSTLWDILQKENTLGFFLNVVMPTANMLASMESDGVLFCVSEAEGMQKELLTLLHDTNQKLQEDYAELTQKLTDQHEADWKKGRETVPSEKEVLRWRANPKHAFNWSSPKQLLWLLRDQLKFDCKKWDKVSRKYKESVDEDVLKRFEEQHPIFKTLLKLRQLEKLDGYFKQWLSLVDKDSRLRASYHQDTVRLGGRLSSSRPNLQQVPRPNSTSGIWGGKNCRQLFRAPECHKLVKVDLKQIEPRLLAHYARDTQLISDFEAGVDFYKVVIANALGKKVESVTPEERAAGKTLGLAIAYGAMAKKVAQIINQHLNLKYDYVEGQQCVDRWWAARRPFHRLRQELTKQIGEQGFIRTFLGRKIYLDERVARQRQEAGKQLNLLNTIAQVSAGDLLNFSQTRLLTETRKLGILTRIVMQVHDEAVWEVLEQDVDRFVKLANMIMCQEMVRRFELSVPLEFEVQVGATWGG